MLLFFKDLDSTTANKTSNDNEPPIIIIHLKKIVQPCLNQRALASNSTHPKLHKYMILQDDKQMKVWDNSLFTSNSRTLRICAHHGTLILLFTSLRTQQFRHLQTHLDCRLVDLQFDREGLPYPKLRHVHQVSRLTVNAPRAVLPLSVLGLQRVRTVMVKPLGWVARP